MKYEFIGNGHFFNYSDETLKVFEAENLDDAIHYVQEQFNEINREWEANDGWEELKGVTWTAKIKLADDNKIIWTEEVDALDAPDFDDMGDDE